MARQKHKHHPILMLAVALVLLSLAALVTFYVYNIILSPATLPQIAIVSGKIATVGLSTYPVAVSFSSPSGSYFTTVLDGRYAISLLSGAHYNVTVTYKALAGIGSGTCYAGTLSLPANSQVLGYNSNC